MVTRQADSRLRFKRTRIVGAPQRRLFDWHARPGAFERLSPPWETIEVVARRGTIRPGDRLEMRLKKGPLWLPWIAEHGRLVDGVSFEDVQLKGPFQQWHHLHEFATATADTSQLEDTVHYRLFGGRPIEWLVGGKVEHELDRMFTYRHRTTVEDLEQHELYSQRRPLHVAITGASGLVGSSLCALLTTGGHRVTRLVRGERTSADDVRWHPDSGLIDDLGGVDAVVHLAGENVGTRWTQETRRKIIDSRVGGTRALVDSLAKLPQPPATFLSASAVGYYGHRESAVAETSPAGSGFLAEVCEQWEAAAATAERFADRVLSARLGVVLTPRGGALRRMLPAFRMGLGGPLGGGDQMMSWIGLDDAVGALLHLLMHPMLSGAVNLVTPHPVSNRDFSRTLGRVLRRPAFFPMPAAAVRLAFGQMGREMLLAGAEVEPRALLANGYRYRHPALETTLRHALGRQTNNTHAAETDATG